MAEENNIPKVYDPAAVEKKWYAYWMKQGYFHQEVDKSRPPFSVVIPPPNITGKLHMGHALDNTLQDILVRWHRMMGDNTCWLPGYDHAGLATQIKVEEELKKKEGLTRYDLGREEFVKRVWQWKEEYGDRIVTQLKSLGISCDWDRQRFTMDEGLSRAVREAFVSLYEKGLIYKGTRMINWCVNCRTALSDVEVEHKDDAGHLWYVKYPVDGEEGVYLTIATTRPETMPGDTAVAVNPKDERYGKFVGKKVKLPTTDRLIPVIADDYVDLEFGTGAVKITPAHDPNDYEMGQRQHLDMITVIGQDGKMTKEAGKYAGQDRYECRKNIVADLEAAGLLVKVEECPHSVGHCQRCGHIVEPLVSTQWFVKMQPLVKAAVDCVEDGRTQFVPSRFTKTYTNWMDNLHDWCISRQIWWGHRIPVWYCDDCGEVTASRTDLDRCPKCGGHVHQDEDALDTWFSSALWPFSTFGWPDKTEELEQFYPTSVLVTGYDIIFFWVARMLVMGMEFMKEIPFKHVFIHGLVRDEQGRKMSKSLGNGIDPLEVVDKYGADTLRFMLITGNTPGNDMRFYWNRIESTRNFANKIWNASRFALMNLDGYDPKAPRNPYTLADKWILSRLQHTIGEVSSYLDKFELGEAGRLIYDFIWGEVCDWYIELIKPRLYNKDDAAERATAQAVLCQVLGDAMKLLHPFMPFITEEIWQHLPHEGESIMIAPWPHMAGDLLDDAAEKQMTALMDVIKAIRNMRAEVGAAPGHKAPALVLADPELVDVFKNNSDYVCRLGTVDVLTVGGAEDAAPENALTAVVTGAKVYLPLKGLIDVEKELARLQKELDGAEKEAKRTAGKLSNAGFLAKAPAEVVEKEKAKQAETEAKIQGLKERMETLRKL
ncbi:valine--tRNA ligase [Acidaminococcus sp. NSJ-142]|jgi:valyl-tRNA synthetase|uniref:valine--tRNA ligase n=1 Tax=Acidaminococcus TaxID=904 RepID=UPI000CF98A08|nr:MULTISPECIES: valine--tRNA ligase [Acidaminococcus]MCD2435119.1 valine--tRNA ligase [Acidaminococcus hominis]MCH4096316.1 valine--tRNA ligase [Acidaminococcus provencensis]RHK02955.1 valine--tRNA ligase [Acidaminococcus sp. AM05-11]